MEFRLVLFKLAALFSFCGGPLLVHEITKPHQRPWLAFLLAFLPVGLMAWGVLALDSRDFTPSERLGVVIGALGSIAAMSLHLFAAWYLWRHPRMPDYALHLSGIAIGSLSTVLYLYFARRWLRSYRCLVAVALAALVSACGTSRNSDCEQMWAYWRPRVIAAAATNRPMPIVPGESVGPVALGMTPAEVARALGPPQRVAFGGWEYPTLGMAVSFENGQVVGLSAGSGSCGDPERLLSKAFAGRFAERVGMGATKQEVIAVLGEPLGPGFVQGHVEMLVYHNMDLAFEDGRWSWLRISLPAR